MPASPTAVAGPAAAPLAAAVRALAIAAAAAASCALAQLLLPTDLGPLFWPAAGIVFGLAWHRGWHWALAAAVGAAAWRWLESGSAPAAVAAFAAVVVGPLAAVGLLERAAYWKPVEQRLESAVRLLLATVAVAAPINAAVTTLAHALVGELPFGGAAITGDPQVPAASMFASFGRAWVADALGLLLLGPVTQVALGALRTSDASLAARRNEGVAAAHGGASSSIDGPVLLASIALAALCALLAHAGQAGAARAAGMAFVPLAAVLALRATAPAMAVTLLAASVILAAVQAHRVGGAWAAAPAQPGFEFAAMLLAAGIVCTLLHAVASDHRATLARLARQAREDLSTGLLNDRGLLAELGERLASQRRVAVGLIGVHFGNFDAVGELCGSLQAMHLEQETAALLARQPGLQVAARLGPGRFALAVEADSVAQVRAVAKDLYSQLNGQLFKTEHGSLCVTASIGGLLVERHALISGEDCLSSLADAMAIAASVRDPQLFVEPLSQTMIDARRAHREKIEHIREAIHDGRIELYAQPLDDLDRLSDRMEYEVLTRLRDRDGSLIPPFEFMPLAVQGQMTVALDRAVVGAVFAWLARHPTQLLRTGKCSINLSGMTMGDASFVAFVRQQRERHRIPSTKIVFEITESEAIRNPAAASRLVEELKAEGFGIALDDFGTGLATFEYLKRFPLDYLKIDGSFIRNIASSPIDEEIVLSTIRVARRLHIKTIAEHVHSEGVLARLQSLGVDHVQGELIGAPRPIGELFALPSERPAAQA